MTDNEPLFPETGRVAAPEPETVSVAPPASARPAPPPPSSSPPPAWPTQPLASPPSMSAPTTTTTNNSRRPWLAAALAAVLGVTAAFLLWLRSEQQAERASDAETALQAANAAGDAAARDAAELRAKVERLERENAELLLLKQELADDVDRLRQATTALEEKMKAEIDAGDVSVVNDNGRLRVDLIDKIVFDSGEAQVSPRGEEVLAKVGAVLASAASEGKVIQVAGHTDDSPPTGKVKEQFPTNWELSVARATNVVRFLQEKSKLGGARLVASGQGQYAPVATNANPRGRARNRRIEILLVPALAPAKAASKTAAK